MSVCLDIIKWRKWNLLLVRGVNYLKYFDLHVAVLESLTELIYEE